jgi:hypothetical protein
MVSRRLQRTSLTGRCLPQLRHFRLCSQCSCSCCFTTVSCNLIRFLQIDSEVFRSRTLGEPFDVAQRNRGSFTIFSDALYYDVPAPVSSWLALRGQRTIKGEFRSRPPGSFRSRFKCSSTIARWTTSSRHYLDCGNLSSPRPTSSRLSGLDLTGLGKLPHQSDLGAHASFLAGPQLSTKVPRQSDRR